MREQADELARGSGQADIHALRDECGKTTEALEELTEGARSAFRDALAESLDGIHRLSKEVESLRSRVAEIRAETEVDETAPDVAEPEVKKNRFRVTVAAGVVVAEVTVGSPAETAGVLRGDVIEEANGVAVHSGSDLLNQAERVASGGDLTLQIRRSGELVVRTVKLGETSAEGGRFGVTVAPGAVVAEVFAGSPAEAAGLARGDVIEDAGGRPIHSGEQLLSIIHAQPEGAEVPLVYTRAGKRWEIVIHLDRA